MIIRAQVAPLAPKPAIRRDRLLPSMVTVQAMPMPSARSCRAMRPRRTKSQLEHSVFASHLLRSASRSTYFVTPAGTTLTVPVIVKAPGVLGGTVTSPAVTSFDGPDSLPVVS